MQVELTPNNLSLVEEFKKLAKQRFPSFESSTTAIVNTAVKIRLESEIEQFKLEIAAKKKVSK